MSCGRFFEKSLLRELGLDRSGRWWLEVKRGADILHPFITTASNKQLRDNRDAAAMY